jgi:tRNA A-37 threonylcarbamoyl transferase component Bud32
LRPRRTFASAYNHEAMPGQDDVTRPGEGAADVTRPGDADITRAGSEPDVTRAGDSVAAAAPGAPAPTFVSRDRYRLGATLGEGGMAVVVEAEDVNLKRTVAIKQLRESLRQDAGSCARFFAEAEILAQLEYAGIVPVHEAGRLGDGAPFYAMAKVRGLTLADLLARDLAAGFRVAMRHVDIILRAAEIVGHAHGRGLMHLDLKPQNIMVDEDGAVYVMDWGIARRLGADASAERGVLRGTPSYMSPEVAGGRADLADARSDVFALGVMLYVVLTGRRPFPGEAGEAIKGITTVTPPEPRRVARHVPRELSAICMKALARNPVERYATARELARDLRDYREFLTISALQPTFRDRVVKWMRRHPRTATALATFVAALLVFGGIRAYRLAAERELLEGFWSEYETIAADLTRLESELAALDANPPPPGASAGVLRRAEQARSELQQRIELRSSDARSVAAATLGLTRGRPDARLVETLSTRVHRDFDSARAAGDFVRMKVLAETRLELLNQLQDRIEWPDEERVYLRERVAEATAELERRMPVQ